MVQKPVEEESKVPEPTAAQKDYTNFFEEIHPFPKDKPMKHTYRVEISRAVYTKECFDIFVKYEKSIHDKSDKSKSSYENFLCQSSLFDPDSNDSEEKFSPWTRGH